MTKSSLPPPPVSGGRSHLCARGQDASRQARWVLLAKQWVRGCWCGGQPRLGLTWHCFTVKGMEELAVNPARELYVVSTPPRFWHMFNFTLRSWSWGRFVFLFAYHRGYLMIDGKGRPCAFILLCQFLQKSRNYISRKKLNKYWWKALLNTLKRWLPWNKSQNCIKCLKASSPSKQRNRDYLVPSLFLFCPLYFIFYLF